MKLSKKERKKQTELEMNYEKNRKQYVSRRLQHCYIHEYRNNEDGGYVCQTCGYYVKDKKIEEALEAYFDSRSSYKISEIKELEKGLRRISWYQNPKGEKIEFANVPMENIRKVIEHFCGIKFVEYINEDGSFQNNSVQQDVFSQESLRKMNKQPQGWISEDDAEKILNGEIKERREKMFPPFKLILSEFPGYGYNGCRSMVKDLWLRTMEDGKTRYLEVIYRFGPGEDIVSPLPSIKRHIYTEEQKLEKVTIKEYGKKAYSLEQ